MNQGDIYLAAFPFTDGSTAKLRPVLVISCDQFNGSEDIVVLPISSKAAPNDQYGIFLDEMEPDFKVTGLKMSSSIKWTKPMTISKTVVRRLLGRLPSSLLDTTLIHLNSLFN